LEEKVQELETKLAKNEEANQRGFLNRTEKLNG
jgi:hypothetical protein